MTRAVLFDLDNTLVDRDSAWASTLDERAPDLDALLRARILAEDDHGRRPRAAYVAWLEEHAPEVLPGEREGSKWRPIARRIAEKTAPFADVPRALARLAGSARLGVVTNGDSAVQRKKIANSALAPLFDVVVVSEEIGAAKPSPRPFLRALSALEVGPEDAVFVGDDPIADIAGAANVGLTTIWRGRARCWPRHIPRPDHVIAGLDELEALLR